MSLTKSATNAHKRTSGHALLCANSFTCGRPFQNQAIGNWNIKMIGIPMFGIQALTVFEWSAKSCDFTI